MLGCGAIVHDLQEKLLITPQKCPRFLDFKIFRISGILSSCFCKHPYFYISVQPIIQVSFLISGWGCDPSGDQQFKISIRTYNCCVFINYHLHDLAVNPNILVCRGITPKCMTEVFNQTNIREAACPNG